jgi:hypothetical protein
MSVPHNNNIIKFIIIIIIIINLADVRSLLKRKNKHFWKTYADLPKSMIENLVVAGVPVLDMKVIQPRYLKNSVFWSSLPRTVKIYLCVDKLILVLFRVVPFLGSNYFRFDALYNKLRYTK